MITNNDEMVFFNRAELSDEGSDMHCEKCFENYVFKFRDKGHEFSIGMSTILKCLKFAEEHGAVPTLPSHWWLSVDRVYCIHRIVESESD